MYYTQMHPTTPTPYARDEHRIIKVYGLGSVSAAPDQAIITLGVVTENPNLQTAQAENNQAMTQVIQSLLTLGVPKENMKTVTYRVEMQYDYDDGKQTLRGYSVTHLLQVTIDQIELTGRIVDTATANGANTITDIRFTLTQPEAYYNQALSLAIHNAQQKAVVIAQTIGVHAGKVPTRIIERSGTAVSTSSETSLYAKSASSPIQPGELKISAEVEAEYAYF